MRALLVVVALCTAAFADKLERPSNDAIKSALDKHLAKHRIAKHVLTPETCKVVRATKQAIVLRCHKRGCQHPCQSVEASAELRFRANGVSSIHNVREKWHGETGACGHCMSTE